MRRRMLGRLRKVRNRILLFYCELGLTTSYQDTSNPRLHLVASILLYDGREAQKVFENLLEEGLFEKLVGIVYEKRGDDPAMWAVALDLLYEMSRMQRLRAQDLGTIFSDLRRVKG